MKLRVAGADDAPFLAEMVRLAASWREEAPGPMTPELERYVRGFGRTGDHGVVAGQRGAAWFRLIDDGYGFVAPGIPELAVAVVPAERGRGLGGALLARLIADAESQARPGLSLSVEPGNPALGLRAPRLREGGRGRRRLDDAQAHRVVTAWTGLSGGDAPPNAER